MRKVLYDVSAKPPDSGEAARPDARYTLFHIDDPRLRALLQTLLMERFQLHIHLETRTGSIYLLERSGDKLALQPAKAALHSESEDGAADQNASMPNGEGSIGGAGGWAIFDTTMPQLAQYASDFILHRPVIDRTELSGAWNYWATRDPPDMPVDEHNKTFLDVLHQTGLKLERSEGPVESIVIDGAQPPSEN